MALKVRDDFRLQTKENTAKGIKDIGMTLTDTDDTVE